MKRILTASVLLAVFALISVTPLVMGAPTNSNIAHLYLYQKTPLSVPGPWPIVVGGAWGKMTYRASGPTFDFVFNGHKLMPNMGYSLIYYADPWPGNNPGAFIASGTSDEHGNIHLMGSPAIGPIPTCPADANCSPAGGGKIWLVLSSDYDAMNFKMVGWNPTEYLFENNLITYTL